MFHFVEHIICTDRCKYHIHFVDVSFDSASAESSIIPLRSVHIGAAVLQIARFRGQICNDERIDLTVHNVIDLAHF